MFRMSKNSIDYFDKINDVSTSGKITTQLEWYWICAQLGLLRNRKSKDNKGFSEVYGEWVTALKPHSDIILGMLFKRHMDSFPKTTEKDMPKYMQQIFTSEGATKLTSEGFSLLDRYAEGGFQEFKEKHPASPTQLTIFLEKYLDELRSSDSGEKSQDEVAGNTENAIVAEEEVDSKKPSWPPQKPWKTAKWVVGLEGILAGSERPGRKKSGDKSPVDRSEIEEWVAAAKEMDPPIESIICLLTEKEMGDCYPCLEGEGGLIQYYQDQGFEASSVECEDYQDLTDEQIQYAVDAFGRMTKPVLVHCSAAVGRTKDAINKGIIPILPPDFESPS